MFLPAYAQGKSIVPCTRTRENIKRLTITTGSAYSYVCTLGVSVAILKMLHISFDFDPKTMVIIILSNYLFFQKK